MSIQFIYDALNDFGKVTSDGSSATAKAFPNIINMGDASIERMTVDLKMPDGAITGTVTLAVTGCATESGTYVAIVTGGAVTAASLIRDGYRLPVPKTEYKYLKVTVAGTFTGTVQALINSYLGK